MSNVPASLAAQGWDQARWDQALKDTEKDKIYQVFEAFEKLNKLVGNDYYLAISSTSGGVIHAWRREWWFDWYILDEALPAIEAKIKEMEKQIAEENGEETNVNE